MKKTSCAAAAVLALTMAGCGTTEQVGPASSPSPTATPTPFSGSDLAGCASYLRVQPKAVEYIKSITSLPAPLSASRFEVLAAELDAGMAAADDVKLAAAATKTSSALRAFSTRLENYSAGQNLDLTAEATSLYEQSLSLATTCLDGKATGHFIGIKVDQ